MSDWVVIAGGLFIWSFVGVVLYRVGRRRPGDDGMLPLAMMWPLLLAAVVPFLPIIAMVWVCWWLTEAPARLATRAMERHRLRQAERAERLREAEQILASEGLDFDP